MPGLHRDATYLVPAQCSLHLWRRTRTPQGRRAFVRWAARLFSRGGGAVVVAGGAAAAAASQGAADAPRPEAMVPEEALMGMHELFDLRRAHGLAFEAWVALLRAAAAEASLSSPSARALREGGGGGDGDDGDDPEDDAALLREASSVAGATALRIDRRSGARRGPGRAAAAAAREDEAADDEGGGGPAAAALVPLSVLRVFAASVLDGAVSVVDGWFEPGELEPGGGVARATSSALMCGAGAPGDHGAAAAAAAASAEAAASSAAAKAHMSRRSSSGAAVAYGAAPLIPALW